MLTTDIRNGANSMIAEERGQEREGERLSPSLETLHFGPEYCGRALSPEEGGEWGRWK
jgi:hypothetical protein